MYVQAGGTPALPDNHLIGTLQIDHECIKNTRLTVFERDTYS
jgi:hypothetical protein